MTDDAYSIYNRNELDHWIVFVRSILIAKKELFVFESLIWLCAVSEKKSELIYYW